MNWLRFLKVIVLSLGAACALMACATTGSDVVHVTAVQGNAFKGLKAEDLDRVSEIRKVAEQPATADPVIGSVGGETARFTVAEYLNRHNPIRGGSGHDYTIGAYDVLKIVVYQEPDLSTESVRVSGDGFISFPLIGRIKVDGLSPSGIEHLIARRLAEGRYVLDAQVSTMVVDFGSKKYSVLGAVKTPGSYPLKAEERLLDAMSSAGGVDAENAGKEAVVIRSEGTDKNSGQKIAITVDLEGLLKGNDQISNLFLSDRDVVYIPKAELIYIIGQVNRPGSYKVTKKDTTLVEAIGMAGGFTAIASRKKTRIIRVDAGVEKIIEVNVDAITQAGKKIQDATLRAGDIIVVPESFF